MVLLAMSKLRKSGTPGIVERRMVESLTDLAEFEEYCQLILPALRKDIAKGLKPEELYTKYTSMAAARGISIALTEPDSGKALSALRDILDRTQGKAVERVQVQHRFQNLKEEELDALLISRAREVEDEGED